MEEPVTCTVVTPGPSAAGKTVYLAALWQTLKVHHPELLCHLSLGDVRMENRLEEVFRQIADPGPDWPPSTTPGDVPEWVFSCKVARTWWRYHVPLGGSRRVIRSNSSVSGSPTSRPKSVSP